SQGRLRSLDLSLADIAEAARSAHSTKSAGYLPSVGGQELPIRVASRARSLNDIGVTPVPTKDGTALSLADVADVRLGPALKRGTASENGSQAVVISIQKSPGTNTLALTDALDDLFDQIEPALPDGMRLNRDVVRQSHFIDRAVDNVTSVLVEAVLIVLAVVALFLMNLRTTLITLTALPISLAVGLLVMDALGLGLNVMSLGGLAIAIGVLVDDAIIDVENVHRRLRGSFRAEGQAKGSPAVRARRSFNDVVFDASNEIRPAMVFATVIIVAVFVPLLFLEGLEGRFFRPLALTYIVSILASLLVALTVTPALCQLLLRGRLGGDRGSSEGPLVRVLKGVYRPVLDAALRMRAAVLVVAAIGVAGAIAVASTFGTSFLPAFNEGTFTLFLMAPPGTSLEESNRLATHVEKQLVELEGVAAVVRRTGRAERDEHAEPVSSSEIDVRLDLDVDPSDVRQRIDALFASVPGITTMVGQPIEHRLSHVLSGTPAAVAISLFGEDLETLRRAAKRVEAELRRIDGARDVSAHREVLVRSIPVEYRRRDLAEAGLSAASAAEQVSRAIHGEVVAEVHDGPRRHDLVVRLVPEERDSIEDLKVLQLVGAGGARVRLGDVATVGVERSSNLITRENAQRKAVVSLNVADGSNLGDLVDTVRARIDPIARSAGLTVRYGGQFEARESAARTIVVSGLVVLAVMLMLLQISTGSLRAAFLVMLNMPLALLGGIAAVFLTGDVPPVLSIAGMVGFITLFG
ncbi:MAG: efflux RND transporter permease subunit, partial [Planctomycetota bacterium]